MVHQKSMLPERFAVSCLLDIKHVSSDSVAVDVVNGGRMTFGMSIAIFFLLLGFDASLMTKQIRVDFNLRNDIREGFDCFDANMVRLAKWLLEGTLIELSCAYGC